MLGKLINFEIKYHTRQVGFWVTVAVMFLVGLLVMSTDSITISGAAGEKVKANGAIAIALQASVLSIGSIFFGAIFVVSGVMRDQVHKALEMVHATPIPTRDMTLSRMIGVYVATFICIFGAVLGLFAGQFAPWVDQETLGPINPLYFLQPAVLYIGVNTLLVSGLFTTVAAVTRNRSLVYVTAVALFIFYTGSGLLLGEDPPDLLVTLSDPFGATALAITTQFWPAAEQNTVMSPIFGYVGLNRLVWGGLGIVLYFATFGLFKRGMASKKSKGSLEDTAASLGQIKLYQTPSVHSGAVALQSFWKRFTFEYLTTVKSIPFIILSLLALSFFGLVIWVQTAFAPDPLLPTNIQMAQTTLGGLAIPLLIIIVFFSGEIIWRDKTAAMTEILDASPVKNWPLMAGKWLSLFAIIVTLVGIGIAVGMVAQIVLGDVPINPSTYLKFAFVSFAPRIILFSCLILFIQNFMPNRVIGMIAAGALLIFFFFILGNLPFAHPMMNFGSTQTGALSEINGYADLTNFKWFAVYWGSLCALFAVLSIWMWRRGTQSSLINRLKSLGKRMTPASAAIATVFLAVFIGSGALIFKAYNIDNDFRTTKQTRLLAVAWEKSFYEIFKKPVPKIRAVETRVDFSPSKRTANVSGSFAIENTTGAPLSDLYVGLPTEHDEDVKELSVTGAHWVESGENAAELKKIGYRLYRFEPALAPDATTKMTFETYFRAPSLGDGSPIQRNGTFVNNFAVMPTIELQDNRMRNPDQRRKHDLPELEKRPDRTDMATRQNNFITRSADYVDFKASVCTDIGQIPIAPGKLMREYEANGKACRDYQAISPILNFFSFLSADYAVKRDVWENPDGENINLAIYYHEPHGYNIDLMLEAMKDSLDTFTKTFGPYQYSQIRIMEFPYGGFAQSFASTIPFSENIGFARNPGDADDVMNLDLATYVTMHEIGHQWFAHQIIGSPNKGFNVLSEGLTENAAYEAYQAKYGWQRTKRLLDQRSIQSYLVGRTQDNDAEPPLAKAEQQQYLDYNKAAWVFWGLKHYMGNDNMQAAIRGFLKQYGTKEPPYPTTIQLVDALRAAAPADMQGLITDYWDRITFWELKIDGDVVVNENPSGGFDVSLTAMVDKKIAAEEDGKETSVTEIDGESLNEWVEIGFYTQDPKETLGDEWTALERVRISELETALSFTMDERPTHVLLDPRRLLMERNVDDNLKKTEAGQES